MLIRPKAVVLLWLALWIPAAGAQRDAQPDSARADSIRADTARAASVRPADPCVLAAPEAARPTIEGIRLVPQAIFESVQTQFWAYSLLNKLHIY